MKIKELQPVVGVDMHGCVVYGRYAGYLGKKEEWEHEIYQLPMNDNMACFTVKKITEEQLIEYLKLEATK